MKLYKKVLILLFVLISGFVIYVKNHTVSVNEFVGFKNNDKLFMLYLRSELVPVENGLEMTGRSTQYQLEVSKGDEQYDEIIDMLESLKLKDRFINYIPSKDTGTSFDGFSLSIYFYDEKINNLTITGDHQAIYYADGKVKRFYIDESTVKKFEEYIIKYGIKKSNQ